MPDLTSPGLRWRAGIHTRFTHGTCTRIQPVRKCRLLSAQSTAKMHQSPQALTVIPQGTEIAPRDSQALRAFPFWPSGRGVAQQNTECRRGTQESDGALSPASRPFAGTAQNQLSTDHATDPRTGAGQDECNAPRAEWAARCSSRVQAGSDSPACRELRARPTLQKEIPAPAPSQDGGTGEPG